MEQVREGGWRMSDVRVETSAIYTRPSAFMGMGDPHFLALALAHTSHTSPSKDVRMFGCSGVRVFGCSDVRAGLAGRPCLRHFPHTGRQSGNQATRQSSAQRPALPSFRTLPAAYCRPHPRTTNLDRMYPYTVRLPRRPAKCEYQLSHTRHSTLAVTVTVTVINHQSSSW